MIIFPISQYLATQSQSKRERQLSSVISATQMSKILAIFVLSKYLVIHELVSPWHPAVEQGRPEGVTNPGVLYQQLLVVSMTHL